MAAATAPLPAPPASSPTRQGAYREVGTVRHASIHAERYRLAGTGKVLADVDVTEGQFHGLMSIGGNLTADRVASEGSLEVTGDVRVADRLAAQGSLRVAGALTAGAAELRGAIRIGHDVRAATLLACRGTFEVGGTVTAGLFAPDGRFAVERSIEAREVAGRFDGDSRVDTILATRIALRPKAWLRLPLDVPPLRPKGHLEVARIEAESVELEGVTVHYLKAPTVVLGRYCHVAQLDGHVVRQDRTSHVGFESRSPPPPGMSH